MVNKLKDDFCPKCGAIMMYVTTQRVCTKCNHVQPLGNVDTTYDHLEIDIQPIVSINGPEKRPNED